MSHEVLDLVNSVTTAATAAISVKKDKYRTYSIKSWHAYQQITPSDLHSIEHYYAKCEELAKDCPEDVMVLRDEITRITGWYWTIGWPAQNCADTEGYVDIRTGKKYPYGMSSFL
jgi:hypothetical protein